MWSVTRMPAPIVFDTEFSSLLHPSIWSVGLITLDGKQECYVELSPDSDAGRARMDETPWDVRENVLELLGMVPGAAYESESAIGLRVGEWVLGVAEASPDGRVELLYDYSVDYELLVGILEDAGLWPAVRLVAGARNVGAETSTIGPELASEATYHALRKRPVPLYRHHALGDAHALRQAWRTWHLIQHRPDEIGQLLAVAGQAREGWLYAWLATPAPALGGRTPLDALDQADGLQAAVEALVEVMERIEGASR